MKKSVFSVERAEDSTGFLLWRVTKLWEGDVKASLKTYGITHPQFVVLTSIFWLSLHKEKINQITLSKHTKIDPMTLSAVLRTLERNHYVTRTDDKVDTRAKHIALTARAEKVITGAIRAIERVDKEFFQKLKKNSIKDFNRSLIELL